MFRYFFCRAELSHQGFKKMTLTAGINVRSISNQNKALIRFLILIDAAHKGTCYIADKTFVFSNPDQIHSSKSSITV